MIQHRAFTSVSRITATFQKSLPARVFYLSFYLYNSTSGASVDNFKATEKQNDKERLTPPVLRGATHPKGASTTHVLSRYAAFGCLRVSVCRIRGKRLVGTYRLEKRGLAGRGEDGWFLESHHRADRAYQREQGEEGKEGVFAQTDKSDYSRISGSFPQRYVTHHRK